MGSSDKAIIKFDADGNLDLFGHNDVLARVFESSNALASFRAELSDFQTFSRCCPEMVAIVNESLPGMPQYVADLPQATLKLMQEGKLFLRSDKEGKLLATLINADNQKIDSIVRLKEVQNTPAVNDVMFSLSFMAITQQLNEIQEGIAQLRQGQIHDRETHGQVAAQNLQWASIEEDKAKRENLCSEAHRNALEGFFACLNTVKESAGFFMDQPSSASLGPAIAQQIAPWNWAKTFRAAGQMKPMAGDLQRSIAKCTYCAQYASASSFLIEDNEQAVHDLEMYAEHMSRTLLGEKADHLRPWLSPKTREALPLLKSELIDEVCGGADVLSYVEKTVFNIEDFSKKFGMLPGASAEEQNQGRELPGD